MKSKKQQIGTAILMVLVLFLSNNLYSQKIYIKPGIGYSLGIDKDYNDLSNNFTNLSQDTINQYSTHLLDKYSYGKGLNYELAIGSYISKNISIELAGFYHKSKVYNQSTEDHIRVRELYNVDYLYDTKIHGKMFGIKPSIVLYGKGKKVRPYVKLGAIIAYEMIKNEEELHIFNSVPGYYPTEYYKRVMEFDKNLSLGYHATLGFEVQVLDNTFFYSELTYNQVKYDPKSAEVTEYVYEDENILSELSTNETYIEFVDSFSTTENDNENTPYKELSTSMSFSHIGIMIGFKFNLVTKNSLN